MACSCKNCNNPDCSCTGQNCNSCNCNCHHDENFKNDMLWNSFPDSAYNDM